MMPNFGIFEAPPSKLEVNQITESRISTVISMLPTALQSRMRPIPLFHQSTSLHSLRTGMVYDDTSDSSSSSQSLSRMDVDNPQTLGSTREQNGGHVQKGLGPGAADQRMTAGYTTPPRADGKLVSRSNAGIHKRFAHQGIGLVGISVEGDKLDVEEDEDAFERKAFIDGTSYLLRALPRDLSAMEIQQIRSALPNSVTMTEDTVVVRAENNRPSISANQPRSMLHRGVQIAVFNIFILFHFLLPYFVMFAKRVARLERRYKVTENLVSRGKEIVHAIGRQGISLTEAASDINDSKFGQGLIEALAWTVEGVSQGISDGVGEGLLVVGSRYIS